jgi:osmotically-inducible protein OsmY
VKKMTLDFCKLALLMAFSLGVAMVTAAAQQPTAQQNPPAQDQTQQQPGEKPPHVDAEPNPEDRKLEQSIQGDLQKDPHMAFSRVRVHVTDEEVQLSGTVLTNTARDQAAQIASQHAGGRKITNRIRVNPNVHPGPGL